MSLKYKEYSNKVVTFISKLNYFNNSRLWWSLNLSSKNPLSSSLINDLFDITDIIKKNKKIHISGQNYKYLNRLQKATIMKFYGNQSKHNFRGYFFFIFIINFFKAIILLINSYFFGAFYSKKINHSQIIIFSFIDSRARKENDIYFGDLMDKIKTKYPKKKIQYLFNIYRPYIKNIQNLASEKNPYSLILAYLKISDYLWCVKEFINLFALNPIIPEFEINKKKIDLSLIIKGAMINEISTGLVDNLLIYRSFIRLKRSNDLETLIYPFENKSFEKLMLFALDNHLKTVGYQHSSITSRHFSLLLKKDELRLIPLPNKIVTTGSITKSWLVNKGNFPKEIIKVGVSLRSIDSKYIEKKIVKDSFKLLFAFSSSHEETYDSINFLKNIKYLDSISIRFRFHPDFPFNGLSQASKNWIRINQIDISNNQLINDFQWTDATCYISSSVAIESILHNVPIIQMNIGKMDCDPLLGEVLPLKWSINNQKDLLEIISIISKIDKFDRKERYLKSKDFIDRYFIRKKLLNVKTFI